MKNTSNNVAQLPAVPKAWHLTHEGYRVTIRFEPRENRKPYRLEWTEGGQDRSEMFESKELAETHGWAKLTALASGQRTLTRSELEELLAFKCKFETLEQTLKTTGRSLDSVVSDLVAACDSLPGWRPSQMAEFLVENHLVKHRMKVKRVAAAFMKHRRSGKERDFDRDTLTYDEFRLADFCATFGEREIDEVKAQEVLRYIMNYQVGPPGGKRPADFDPSSLRPASQFTKRALFSLLNCLFLFAKSPLRALRPHAATVLELLDRPQFVSPARQIYPPREIPRLCGAMPDVESILYVGMQALAGLTECQARRVESKDIVLRSAGVEPHIIVTEETGLKDPLTGEVQTRTHLAPITPPLEALFAKIKLPPGRIIRSKSIAYKVKRAARAAGITWIQGGLRNSFIANRLAAGHDLSTVSYEAGFVFERDVKWCVGLANAAGARAYWRIRIDPGNRIYTSARIAWKKTPTHHHTTIQSLCAPPSTRMAQSHLARLRA